MTTSDLPSDGFAAPGGPAPQPVVPSAPPAPAYAQPADLGTGLAIAAAALSGLLGIVWVGYALTTIPLAGEIADGISADDASLATLGPYSLAGLLSYVLILPVWVLTAVWLIKAREAAARVAPYSPQRHGNAWVVLGWVVPIANLFVPVRVVGDVTRAVVDRRTLAYSSLLEWWWGSFLVTLVLYRVHTTAFNRLAPGEPAGPIVVISLLLAAVTLLSLVLWLLVVRRVVTGLAERALRG